MANKVSSLTMQQEIPSTLPRTARRKFWSRNNKIWGSGTAGGSSNANITTGSNTVAGSDSFKNNIIGQANGNEIEIPSGGNTNFTSDYNDFYHPAGENVYVLATLLPTGNRIPAN